MSLKTQKRVLKNKKTFHGVTRIHDGLFMAEKALMDDYEFLGNNDLTQGVIFSTKKQINQTIELNAINWSSRRPRLANLLFTRFVPLLLNSIELASKKGESLVLFVSGAEERSFALITGYLMEVFKWSFLKAVQFLDQKIPGVSVRKQFFNPLKDICNDFELKNSVSINWNFMYKSAKEYRDIEILLTNTYLNSLPKSQSNKNYNCSIKYNKLNKVITWADKQFKSNNSKKSCSIVSIPSMTSTQTSHQKIKNNDIKPNLSTGFDQKPKRKIMNYIENNHLFSTEGFKAIKMDKNEIKKTTINNTRKSAINFPSNKKSFNRSVDKENRLSNERNSISTSIKISKIK